jgi:tetratricopeptide (TPR) repeat protein
MRMTIELSGRRVFIASPGGLEDERREIRQAIADFNERLAPHEHLAFLPCGWETVVGTVRRPQEAINAMLLEADYAIFVLRDRWGTPPGDEKFTSGTEEEYHQVLAAIRDAACPMIDMLVIFMTVPRAQLSDPGPILTKVLEFRATVEREKVLLYNAVDSIAELRQRVDSALVDWARPKQTKREIGSDGETSGTFSGQIDAASDLSPTDMALRASQHADRGESVQAEVLYSRAARSGDPQVLLKYARFMRRTGRLERAAQLNAEVIEIIADSHDPSLVGARASALANLGVVRRKQGGLRDSRMHLEEAVRTSRSVGDVALGVLEYSLDNLGITCVQQGDDTSAIKAFEESLTIREESADQEGQASSLINIARVHLNAGGDDEARIRLEKAIGLLARRQGNESAVANALVALGQLLLRAGDAQGAIERFDEALKINRETANSDGIGIASALRAQAALDIGDLESARVFTEISHAESVASGNQQGELTTRQLRARVAMQRGNRGEAVGELQKAVGIARRLGSPDREEAVLSELEKARESG